MGIADDMGRKQREISVSEFFEKNRHLLGYDNKAKAMLVIVKEAVDNSVEYDEPVLVRMNGQVKLVKIGKFIDELMGGGNECCSGAESSRVAGVEAMVYDDNTFGMGFRPVSSVHRHPLHDKLYEITLTGNRKVKVTGSHSVFVLKDGKILPYPVRDIRANDFVVVPRKKIGMEGIKEIDLRGWVAGLHGKSGEKIMLKGVSSFFEDVPRDWRRFDFVPLGYFIDNDLEIPENAKVNVRSGGSPVPVSLEVTPELMRLLGYYAAEGTCYEKWITLSFGISEETLINDARHCIRKTFPDVSFGVVKAHRTAVTVKIYSKMLAILFRDFFNAGCRADTKKVPGIVFNAGNDLQKEFLMAYIAGDGHVGGQKITMATVSKELSVGIKYLFALNGIPFSEYEKNECIRHFRGHSSRCKKAYYIYVYRQGAYKNSPLNWVPLEESGLRSLIKGMMPKIGSFNPHYRLIDCRENFTFESSHGDLKLALAHKRCSADAGRIRFFESLFSGDIGFLKVKKIGEVHSRHRNVYDFSVPGHEKFLGGEGCVFLHNSLDACEEARIVPEIYVGIKQLEEEKFEIKTRDNGPGIVKEQVPRIFGSLLYGSKFHRLKQSRGQQGLGISCAVLYSQLTTGSPTTIVTSTGDGKTNIYHLKIDVGRNRPIMVETSVDETRPPWHGLEVTFVAEATYRENKQSVLEYLKQTAISNPYADITFDSPTNGRVEFKRGVATLPPESREIMPHIEGVEIGVLMRMIANTKERTILSFLMGEFSRLGRQSAGEILMRAGMTKDVGGQKVPDVMLRPSRVTDEQMKAILDAVKDVRLMRPPTDCLSPLGRELIESGLSKELNPEFVAAVTRPPEVYRGWPFQIEVGIAFGGSIQGFDLLRFANRVPLLYQGGVCAMSKAVEETDWRRYSLQVNRGTVEEPLVVFVHMASVWVPFTSESKEAIANYEIIIKEMKLALQECSRNLSLWLSGKRKSEMLSRKRSIFERYARETARALGLITDRPPEELERLISSLINEKWEVSNGEQGEGENTETGPGSDGAAPEEGES